MYLLALSLHDLTDEPNNLTREVSEAGSKVEESRLGWQREGKTGIHDVPNWRQERVLVPDKGRICGRLDCHSVTPWSEDK